MNFTVRPEIFEKFPNYVVGVVVIAGADNSLPSPQHLLAEACRSARENIGNDPRNHPMVKLWRDAFTSIGYNPNKFQPSIDALSSRIAKTGAIPSINAAVDIINAHSLTYLLPMGAHDIARLSGDFEVRMSKSGEVFSPMGGGEIETVPEGEFVYADDLEVRTRRWIWRQGDKAKVVAESSSLFCPIDGWSDSNLDAVLAARESLARELVRYLGGTATQHLINAASRSAVIR